MGIDVGLYRARVGNFYPVALASMRRLSFLRRETVLPFLILLFLGRDEIGRASCRERVFEVV